MTRFYKNGPLTGVSSPVGQDSCRWVQVAAIVVTALCIVALVNIVREFMASGY